MSVSLSEDTRKNYPLLPLDSGTSHKDKIYNCVAWAAARHKAKWWEPLKEAGCCWPTGIPFNHEFSSYVKVFELLGYEDCKKDDSLENGYEKVALFKDIYGWFTHVSHQLETGEWTSKLGPDEDVKHMTNAILESFDNGQVEAVMKRKRQICGLCPNTNPTLPPLDFF